MGKVDSFETIYEKYYKKIFLFLKLPQNLESQKAGRE